MVCPQLDVRSLRVKLADFGLSRTVDRMGNDISLFHARWTAPEVWDDFIVDEHSIEGKFLKNSVNRLQKIEDVMYQYFYLSIILLIEIPFENCRVCQLSFYGHTFLRQTLPYNRHLDHAFDSVNY